MFLFERVNQNELAGLKSCLQLKHWRILYVNETIEMKGRHSAAINSQFYSSSFEHTDLTFQQKHIFIFPIPVSIFKFYCTDHPLTSFLSSFSH